MSAAPMFSPIKKRSVVKSLSIPTRLTEIAKPSRPAQIPRSSSTRNDALDDDDDDLLSDEHLSPVFPLPRSSWKDDLDEWLPDPADNNPPPELGREGMTHKQRKESIGKALDWLKVEMGRMREERKQLTDDFKGLSEDVHKMNMEAVKTKSMLKYRSFTSMGSLMEFAGDEGSDEMGSLDDFSDGSLMANVSRDSLLLRQEHAQKRRTSKDTASSQSDLLRQVLTPGGGVLRTRTARRKEGASGPVLVHSTPKQDMQSQKPIYSEAWIPPSPKFDLPEEAAESAQQPSSFQNKPLVNANIGSVPESRAVSTSTVEITKEQLVTRMPSASNAVSNEQGPIAVESPANGQVYGGNGMANTTQGQTKPTLDKQAEERAVKSAKQPGQQRQDSLELLARMSSPHSLRRRRRGTDSDGDDQSHWGVGAGVHKSPTTQHAGLTNGHTPPQAEKPESQVAPPEQHQQAGSGYMSPPNIPQVSLSLAFSSDALQAGRSPGLPRQRRPMTVEETAEQEAALTALARSSDTLGGTLPRRKKTHLRTSSTTSAKDLVDVAPMPIIAVPQEQNQRAAPNQVASSLPNSLLRDNFYQSSSMPSIRDASDDTAFSSQLQHTKEMNKQLQHTKEMNKHETVEAHQHPTVIVRKVSPRKSDRGQPGQRRPQSMPSPFFQPTSACVLRQFQEQVHVPSPVYEGGVKRRQQPGNSGFSVSPENTRSARYADNAHLMHHHSHHQPHQHYHARTRSADFVPVPVHRSQTSDVSPLVSPPIATSTNVPRRTSLESFSTHTRPYAGIPRRSSSNSLSMPSSPGLYESSSVPGSPKVSRSHSDVQHNDLAITLARRCLDAKAAAPILPASRSPSLRQRNGTAFPFTSPTDDGNHLHPGNPQPAWTHGSMESLV